MSTAQCGNGTPPDCVLSNKVCIPSFFEKHIFKRRQIFLFRVTNIYDPTKFWITLKYKELQAFQKYLFRWYYMNCKKYKMPETKMIKDCYCIVFVDGGYYRAIISSFPINSSNDLEVQVLLIDFGVVRIVEMKQIYYMHQKFVTVPQLAARATLAGICPKGGNTWTSNDVNYFNNLMLDKILVGIVLDIDHEKEILHINCCEKVNDTVTIPIHKTMVKEKKARYVYSELDVNEEHSDCKLYLFPTHEQVESGKVPLTVFDAEYQDLVVLESSYRKILIERFKRN